MNDTVMIAMSGGVDSAVAAYLTKESAQGAAGVTMNLCYGQIENACAAQADAADAAAVCRALQIPHFVANLGKA